LRPDELVESGVLNQNSSNDLIFPTSQENGTGWVHIDGNAGRKDLHSLRRDKPKKEKKNSKPVEPMHAISDLGGISVSNSVPQLLGMTFVLFCIYQSH
jgi:hypothetical protein